MHLFLELDEHCVGVAAISEGRSAKVDPHLAGIAHLQELYQFYYFWWINFRAVVLVLLEVLCSYVDLKVCLCAEITGGVNGLGILQILACLGILRSQDQ